MLLRPRIGHDRVLDHMIATGSSCCPFDDWCAGIHDPRIVEETAEMVLVASLSHRFNILRRAAYNIDQEGEKN